jgi:hypothetical protein
MNRPLNTNPGCSARKLTPEDSTTPAVRVGSVPAPTASASVSCLRPMPREKGDGRPRREVLS